MGEFNYKKEYDSWKWDIPKKYNIGFDCVDKHTLTNKKTRLLFFGKMMKAIQKNLHFKS